MRTRRDASPLESLGRSYASSRARQRLNSPSVCVSVGRVSTFQVGPQCSPLTIEFRPARSLRLHDDSSSRRWVTLASGRPVLSHDSVATQCLVHPARRAARGKPRERETVRCIASRRVRAGPRSLIPLPARGTYQHFCFCSLGASLAGWAGCRRSELLSREVST